MFVSLVHVTEHPWSCDRGHPWSCDREQYWSCDREHADSNKGNLESVLCIFVVQSVIHMMVYAVSDAGLEAANTKWFLYEIINV